MTLIEEILVSAFLIVGGVFGLVGSLGLVKLRDTMQRLHAPTKATTLGIGGLLVASMINIYLTEGRVSFHELLITLFLFITAPVSANFIAKTFMQDKVRSSELPSTDRDYGWAVYDDPPPDGSVREVEEGESGAVLPEEYSTR